MSYTYGHEAAKKKHDINTMRNLVRKGIKTKKAKKLAKKIIADSNTPLIKGIAGMDSLGRSASAYIQSWQDRNRSNNGTKLNP